MSTTVIPEISMSDTGLSVMLLGRESDFPQRSTFLVQRGVENVLAIQHDVEFDAKSPESYLGSFAFTVYPFGMTSVLNNVRNTGIVHSTHVLSVIKKVICDRVRHILKISQGGYCTHC